MDHDKRVDYLNRGSGDDSLCGGMSRGLVPTDDDVEGNCRVVHKIDQAGLAAGHLITLRCSGTYSTGLQTTDTRYAASLDWKPKEPSAPISHTLNSDLLKESTNARSSVNFSFNLLIWLV